MKIALRPYQEQSVYKINRALNAREHPLCVLPTGGGKSLVLAKVAQDRATRVLVLSHMRELLEQDSRALRALAPELPQSFYSAGLKEKRGHTQVVFGSVQTVVRSLEALGQRNLLLIDEAHLCPRDADAMYAKVFAHFSLALRAGFTATNQRIDSGTLTSGADAWFTCVADEVAVTDLIAQGYLVPLVGVLTEHQADLDGVGSRGGDFIAGQAEEAVSRTLSTREVVQEMLVLAKKRRHWLIFAAGIDHAREVLEELRSEGVDSEIVIGDTPSAQRDDAISRFRDGELRALVNVGVLTTGFDAPQTDCVAVMRPTKSPILWQQIMGRGMRLASNKKNCLLLDFVGNLERLGGAGCVVQLQDSRADVNPVKKANVSKRVLTARNDPEFMMASLADPMKSGQSFDCRVTAMRYFTIPSHRFRGKNQLIASYSLEDENGTSLQARSFVAVEYPGSARFHAMRWFARRGLTDSEQVPKDARTALALAKTMPAPTEARVFWDPRLKCYLVMEERFSASEQ